MIAPLDDADHHHLTHPWPLNLSYQDKTLRFMTPVTKGGAGWLLKPFTGHGSSALWIYRKSSSGVTGPHNQSSSLMPVIRSHGLQSLP